MTGALAVVAMWDDPTQDILVMAREEVACALVAAHDPALGEEASVRLGDVLDFLRSQTDQTPTFSPRMVASIIELVHRIGKLGESRDEAEAKL
jgi:hypothetical protein